MASALWGELPGDSAPPTGPGNLTAQAASKPAINLAWTASTDNAGVAGYGVYRDGGLIATATSTSYNDRNLAANTRYCYIARALDAAGNLSAPSNQACATTPKR